MSFNKISIIATQLIRSLALAFTLPVTKTLFKQRPRKAKPDPCITRSAPLS